MTRGQRIALQLFGPPLLGALTTLLPLMVGGAIVEGQEIENPLETLILVIFYAYFVAALPTLTFTLVMECCFARGLKPGSWIAIGLSTALGGIAGALLGGLFSRSGASYMGAMFLTGGATTGFTIGVLIRLFESGRPESGYGVIGRKLVLINLLCAPALAWLATRHGPAWAMMWAVAAAEFFALKLLTLVGRWHTAPAGRIAAYLALWPGMDASAFLDPRPAAPPPVRELAFALAKLALGLVAGMWAAAHAATLPMWLVAWAGMIGIIFTLHFGLLHVLSWLWRRAGVVARPIMGAPVRAESVAEFWGARWNLAFSDLARPLLLRPFARRWGARRAGALVFLVSGLVHETVISLPARGGWGGPTLYFLLQAGGAAFEKSAAGRRLGLGAGGRGCAWALLVAAAPVPLLLHAPFAREVIVPFFQFLGNLLP